MPVTTIESTAGVAFASGVTAYDYLLQNLVQPVLQDTLNNATPVWSMMDKRMASGDGHGRYRLDILHTGRNIGRGHVRADGAIPLAGSQKYAMYAYESRTYMARIKMSGEMLDRAGGDGAVTDPLEAELNYLANDMQVDFGREIHNDGSGRLAEISSVADTVITLRINQSIPGATLCPTRPTIYLEIGDRVGFYNPATDALRTGDSGTQSGWYVKTIPSSTTITICRDEALAGAAVDADTDITSLTAGDWVVRVSNEFPSSIKGTSARAEIMGLGGVISTGGALDGNGQAGAQHTGGGSGAGNPLTATSTTGWLFQGVVASSANPYNQCLVSTSGSGSTRSVSEELIQSSLSDFEEQNNGDCKVFIMPYAIYNSFVSTVRGDKRYNDTTEIKAGVTGITYNGIGTLKDRFSYGGRILGVDPERFAYYEVAPMQPMAPLGLPRWERLADTEAYWTGMKARGNIATDVRQRAGFAIVDLA